MSNDTAAPKAASNPQGTLTKNATYAACQNLRSLRAVASKQIPDEIQKAIDGLAAGLTITEDYLKEQNVDPAVFTTIRLSLNALVKEPLKMQAGRLRGLVPWFGQIETNIQGIEKK